MTARLEHVNVTVSDPHATAAWLGRVFGWTIRWEGDAKDSGYTCHVGEEDTYVALYAVGKPKTSEENNYTTTGGLNHWAVVVDDLDATEDRVKAEGFTPHAHGNYEPGRRFYFDDHDGIEIEVVSYN
ncbi:MAG: VOC family protein [Pseudomonadota bacterium]